MELLIIVEYRRRREPLEKFGKKISVEAPSFVIWNQWRLRPEGYVGYIPVNDDLALFIKPKLPLQNLFSMLKVAYQFKEIDVHD